MYSALGTGGQRPGCRARSSSPGRHIQP